VIEKVLEVNGIKTLMFYKSNFLNENGDTLALNNRPVVVELHGGPHSNVAGYFNRFDYYHLYKGYIVLFPAFSGTLGFG
jgi:acylaminoacyl-peptidase